MPSINSLHTLQILDALLTKGCVKRGCGFEEDDDKFLWIYLDRIDE